MQIDFARMRSRVMIATPAVILGFTALVSPVHAAPRGGLATASLAAPLSEPRQQILGGVLWKCAGERCTAPADGSRPVVSCQRVARAFGTVAAFATPAGEIARDELTRCNAS